MYAVFQWKLRGLYAILARFGNRELRLSPATSESTVDQTTNGGARRRETLKNSADRTDKKWAPHLPRTDIPTGVENENYRPGSEETC